MSGYSHPSQQNLFLWFFLAYAGGISIAPFFPQAESSHVLCTAVTTLLILIVFRKVRIYVLIILLAFSGFVLYHWSMASPEGPGHIIHLAGKQATVEGYVNCLTPRITGALLDLEVTGTATIEKITPVNGKAFLFIRNGVPDIFPGDKVRVTAHLRKPKLYGVPGEFNYSRHLAQKDVYVTGSVTDAKRVIRLAGDKRENLGDIIEGFRHAVRSFITTAKPEMAPYLRALTIGDRGGLGPEEKSLLGRSGVAHLFAISGLHMGIIFLFSYGLLKFCYRRSKTLLLLAPPKQILPLLISPLLFFYLFLAGGGIPTQRAFSAMLLCAILFYLGYLVKPIRIVLSLAFFLILIDPLALFSPSYQLSFAAVLGILYYVPKLQKRASHLPKFIRYPADLFFVTFTATLATLPFVLFHFHVFSLSGLLLNLICVPLISFLALPCALAGAALFSFSTFLGGMLFEVSAMVLDLSLSLINILTPAADSTWSTIYLTPFQMATLILLIIALLMWEKVPLRPPIFWSAVAGLSIFLLAYPLFSHKPFMLTAINVGHGDAMVISKDDKYYLVDGGGFYNDNFDVGSRLLAPALGSMGIKEIEAVILTHAHPDHFKGLGYILKHFQVREFWSAITPDRLPEIIRTPLKARGIPLKSFPEGWTTIQQEAEGRFSIFVPVQDTPLVNDRSLAIYMKEGNNSLLLTGDLEKNGIEQLLKNSIHSKASLLKLAHHGSSGSSPARLIGFFRPKIVFATTESILADKDYFPNPDDPRRIHSYAFDGQEGQGSIRFVAEEGGWAVRYWQRGLFR